MGSTPIVATMPYGIISPLTKGLNMTEQGHTVHGDVYVNNKPCVVQWNLERVVIYICLTIITMTYLLTR